MDMTDAELDRDWKPNGRRPQSTIARSFSQELVDIFRIENSVADLDEKVNQKKQQINNQTSELEALEARIREMEQRLKQGPAAVARPSGSPRSQRPPVANAFDGPNAPPPPPAKDYPTSPNRGQQQQNKYGGSSQPGTARPSQQAVPGALPPTPVGSEGECEPPVTTAHSRPRVTVVSRPSAAPPPPPRQTSSSSTARAYTNQRKVEDDSASAKSMSESVTSADYVIVPRLDGDRDQDA
ncbi:hypothetical protein B0H66DRAFT_606356 [Apodospora peruviana]|uniref:Uncharacterized protein n=1 Tax=Apodospora peruviana TaxID=516989 RepID=A0AAE0HYY4_9PEZI|nr:hypothetical protein B0H66DRAFT_606356 [Apodospora peruviana]